MNTIRVNLQSPAAVQSFEAIILSRLLTDLAAKLGLGFIAHDDSPEIGLKLRLEPNCWREARSSLELFDYDKILDVIRMDIAGRNVKHFLKFRNIGGIHATFGEKNGICLRVRIDVYPSAMITIDWISWK